MNFDEEDTRASKHKRIRIASGFGGVSEKRRPPNERYCSWGKALFVGNRLIKDADGMFVHDSIRILSCRMNGQGEEECLSKHVISMRQDLYANPCVYYV